MIIFYLLTLIALLPFAWSVQKTLEEKRYVDVCLQAMIFVCCLGHFYMFYCKFFMMMPEDNFTSLVHCVSTAMIVPPIYMYICRKIGAVYGNNSAVLVTLALLAFIPQGVINLGFGDLPENAMPKEMFQINIYHNGTLLLHPMTYSMVVVLQALFSAYRTLALLITMARRNYHYSDNYKMFLRLIGAAIVTIFLSYMPENDFWYGRWTCVVLVGIFMTYLGIGFVLMALKFDEAPLVDENNEPVLIETPRKFTELATKFSKLIKDEKPYLTNSLLMEDVAKMLGTNRTYVAQMIKEEFGQTFTSYMNNCRVEEAKRLISEHGAEETLQDIAFQSGFNSVSSFNKVFKSVTGVAPSEWR